MTETALSAAAQTLARLAAEAWDGSMAALPLYATSLGDRRYLTKLSPNDPGADDREAARARDLIARTTAVAADDLTAADRVTRLALLDNLAYELGLAESGIASWTVDPLDGPQVQFLNVEAYQPMDTPADGRAAIERWQAMGPWVDQHVAGIQAGLSDRRVTPPAP